MPIDRSAIKWKLIKPSSPTKTVRPEKTTAPAGGRDGQRHRTLDAGPNGQLLAKAADHEERVVDPEPEPEHGDQVEREYRELGHPGQQRHQAERAEHRGATDRAGEAAATSEPKTQTIARIAKGREMSSARRMSCSVTSRMSA